MVVKQIRMADEKLNYSFEISLQNLRSFKVIAFDIFVQTEHNYKR